MFSYVISLGVVTLRRSSGVIHLHRGESALWAGLSYSAISAVAGWWGIPWGPIFTIRSLLGNARGGLDVTEAALAVLSESPIAAAR